MYPNQKDYSKHSYALMTSAEAEAYERALATYHCKRYANERIGDGFEVIATMLAEYAIDSMHEDDGLPESVYKYLDNDTHWVWDIALKVQTVSGDR